MPENPRGRQPAEDELIELVKAVLGGAQAGAAVTIGDDAAVLRHPAAGEDLVVTTDMLVEGTHFRLEWSSPFQAGWKAMVASVSDIAAMGGRPAWAVVSAGVRARSRENFVKHMYEGIRAAAEKYGVTVAGGDTVRSDTTVINVAMGGTVVRDRALLRRGAKPGDILAVTGTCGDGAAGLEILGDKGKKNLSPVEKALVDRHLAPATSVEAGLAAAASGAVTAMMDLSDGLAADLPRLAARSGCGAVVRTADLPLSRELADYCRPRGADPVKYALSAGEDFNLLMAVDKGKFEVLLALAESAGAGISAVGQVLGRSAGLKLLTRDGKTQPMPAPGFDHF